jgi:integrase
MTDEVPSQGERKAKGHRGDGRVYQRGSRWWIEYWNRGEQFRESAGKDEATAQKKLRARLKEIAGDKFIGPREERVSVGELIDDLMTHLRTKGAKAVASFESHLKPVRAFFSKTRAMDVTTALAERFIEDRLAEGKARATVNRETGALRQALHLAARRKPPKITRVPYIPSLNEDNARQGFVEPATFEAIASRLPEPVGDIARFAYLSGWRKGEVMPLRWDAVDRRAREARLRTSKNGRPRTLPLTGALWEVIERRWQAREYATVDGVAALSEYVFHAGEGRAIVDFKRSWATACRAAGVPGLLFHDLRRSAVRNMIRAGVPQSVAMRISGHRTAAMFLRYDITSDEDKRDALAKTEARNATQAATSPKVATFERRVSE